MISHYLAISITIAACLNSWGCSRNSSPDPLRVSRGSVKNPRSKDNAGAKGNVKKTGDGANGEPLTNLTGQEKDLDALAKRAKICRPVQSSHVYPSILEGLNQTAEKTTVNFETVRQKLEAGCGGCHLAPARETGGFGFLASKEGKTILSGGVEKYYPGIKEAAEKIAAALLAVEADKQMPIGAARKQNEAEWIELGRTVLAWQTAGFPEGTFEYFKPVQENSLASAAPIGSSGSRQRIAQVFKETDLGDCVPEPDQAGHDLEMDAFFAQTNELPKLLSETDLFTNDSLELARNGTFSYNVEYPLWADNAEKGRYVHLPSSKETLGNLVRSPAQYDAATGDFKIPANTRFYKTFYKAVNNAAGERVFQKIETRIIVVRYPPAEPIMGSYHWNAEQTEARLVDVPYRDGSKFKDKIFLLEVDQKSRETRKYAIPGYQRCVECHQGSEGGILGFSALQLNRRSIGEGGREFATGPDELGQVKRLLSYNVLAGVESMESLPKLESAKGLQPRNEHELKLQGYLTGNCAHCHNPERGYAIKKGEVKLELTAGRLYDFDARASRSAHFDRASNKLFVNTKELESSLTEQGDAAFVNGIPSAATLAALRTSYLFLRVAATSKDRDLLPFNAMPMHTPGGSNCKLVNLTARWILSLTPGADPEKFNLPCNEFQQFSWIDLDTTEAAEWLPRRADWNKPEGMPENFRNLVFDDEMRKIARYKYPLGYYDTKAECAFPEVKAPVFDDPFWQTWMFKGGVPTNGLRRPLSELYFIKPGAYFYNSMCAKCHGTRGDGQGPFSTSLNVLSDGDIRVANFSSGLFKPDGSNIAQFNLQGAQGGQNLAGNYLIWMAMGGTKVNFPESVSELTGKHKALMLNLVRDACSGFLPNAPGQLAVGKIQYRYGLLKDICFHDNGRPDGLAAELGFDPNTFPAEPLNPKLQDAWLDKAAFNAGWAIYDYLQADASQGNWQPNLNECEKAYPVP